MVYSLWVDLFLLPQSEALERPSATLRVAEWGFAFERKPSGSLLTSGGAKKSSPETNTPLPSLLDKLEFDN